MIVCNPTDTTHSIDLLPRYYPTDDVDLYLYNETTKKTDDVVNTYTVVDGIFRISFDYDFIEQSKYQVKIIDSDGVVFRGKLIATSQTPQDFSQTKDLYYYE